MRAAGPTRQEARSWRLDDGFAELAVLRQELRSFLAAQGALAAATADVVLATQEAAKNALRASSGRPVTVRAWIVDGIVWVSVRDHGQGFPASSSRHCPSPWSTHGRGLCLMDALMDEVTISLSGGTTVVMRRELPRASAATRRSRRLEPLTV